MSEWGYLPYSVFFVMKYFYSLSLTILLPPDLCGCYINPIKLKVLRSWYWNCSRKAVVLLENKSRPEESPAQTWIIKTSIFKVLTAIFSLKNYSECLIYRHAIIFFSLLPYFLSIFLIFFSFLFFLEMKRDREVGMKLIGFALSFFKFWREN